MSQTLLRLCVGVLVVLILTSCIIANDLNSPVAEESASDATQRLAIAEIGSSGMELALLCIVLGGAMAYLFRPKRRYVPEPIKIEER